ncbi:MAG: hypothetical protein HFJ80_06550 [Clostridiales bacterium]|nr:hypothetical protein [Clostridiales bacterium]
MVSGAFCKRFSPELVEEILAPILSKVCDRVTEPFDVEFAVMNAGYKTPWSAKKVRNMREGPSATLYQIMEKERHL